MRDHDARDALLLEAQQEFQKSIAFFLVQCRCRLIQDQQLDIFCQSLGDLDHLLLPHAEVTNQTVDILMHADAGQDFRCFTLRGIPIDDMPEFQILIADKDVFRNG